MTRDTLLLLRDLLGTAQFQVDAAGIMDLATRVGAAKRELDDAIKAALNDGSELER